ncbi:MAG: fructose,6-bisphosphatase, partial [Campylobacterota bacterium]|nr:fructose,6-bisphosphatase [Campylobacterota bacterium]
GYRLRYSGGMVPDLHQILIKGGGLFSYPSTTDKPKGKLRMVFEVFPFAHIFEIAGGMATDGQNRILDLIADNHHDTTPCFLGSIEEIEMVKERYANK